MSEHVDQKLVTIDRTVNMLVGREAVNLMDQAVAQRLCREPIDTPLQLDGGDELDDLPGGAKGAEAQNGAL